MLPVHPLLQLLALELFLSVSSVPPLTSVKHQPLCRLVTGGLCLGQPGH